MPTLQQGLMSEALGGVGAAFAQELLLDDRLPAAGCPREATKAEALAS